jgi:hypothetical protein
MSIRITLTITAEDVRRAATPFLGPLGWAVGHAHDNPDWEAYKLVLSDALDAAYAEGVKFGLGQVIHELETAFRGRPDAPTLDIDVTYEVGGLGAFRAEHEHRWEGAAPWD